MSILSLYFIIFLLVLVGIYYVLPPKARPYVLLLGSISFYLTFNWRYFFVLLISIYSVWINALKMERAKDQERRRRLILTVGFNIGLLFAVKFLPWFVNSARDVQGGEHEMFSLLVPVGISFYTLQILGYLMDVYRKKYEPQHNFFKFMLFASFFPTILQGPISRYDQLGDQLFNDRRTGKGYENFLSGAQLMLWGYFKKMVIADRLAIGVNAFYGDFSGFGAIDTLIVIVAYAIQLYTDFSGCVDICRGAALLFGVDLMDNFDRPYFATSVQDFWRRWHISLSTWFRDYLYIPLGGNRKGTARKYLNILIVFLVSGLWHGVGIHFLVWGLIHGLYQVIGGLTLPLRQKLWGLLHLKWENPIHKILQILVTFPLICLSWVFFRATDTGSAAAVIAKLFTGWELPFHLELFQLDRLDCLVLLAALAVLLVASVIQYFGVVLRDKIARTPFVIRWAVYLVGFLAVLILGIYGPGFSESAFIYMNF